MYNTNARCPTKVDTIVTKVNGRITRLTARDELFFRHEAAPGIVIPEVEIYLMHMIPSGLSAERLRFSLQHASAISEIPLFRGYT